MRVMSNLRMSPRGTDKPKRNGPRRDKTWSLHRETQTISSDTETSYVLVATLDTILSNKRITRALIRLRIDQSGVHLRCSQTPLTGFLASGPIDIQYTVTKQANIQHAASCIVNHKLWHGVPIHKSESF